jgi:hypothetical protein
VSVAVPSVSETVWAPLTNSTVGPEGPAPGAMPNPSSAGGEASETVSNRVDRIGRHWRSSLVPMLDTSLFSAVFSKHRIHLV